MKEFRPPIQVACPHCAVPVGHRCISRKGKTQFVVHRARLERWRDVVKLQREAFA